jgi:hypothetical protein
VTSPFKRTSVIAPNMYEGARLVTPRPGSYERLANKLIDEMDKRSFDPHAFAYLLSTYPEPVQVVMFQLVISLLNAWAGKRESRSEEEAIRRNEAKFVINRIIEVKGGNPL